jgi:putative copper resistance protein D
VLWFEPGPAVVLIAAAVAYVCGVRAVAGRGRRWPIARTAAFAGGLLVLAVATESALAKYDRTSFTAHVVQHVLIGMCAPPLLALAAPATLALQATRRSTRARLNRVLRSPAVAVLTHPCVGWLLFVVTPFVLYLTPLYDLTLRHALLHTLVHVHFLVAGVVFMWPLFAIDPVRWRLMPAARVLALVLALPAHAFLGLAMMSTEPDWRVGGAVMWVAGDVVIVGLIVLVAARWMAEDARTAAREDRYVSKGLMTSR